MTKPYLSIVATARNDNHGGDLLGRMQLFVENVIGQCNRHGIPAELVLVEWNPPADRPRLIDALDWPVDNECCAVRVIEVPPAAHSRLRHSERLPLFQMIAKNVGIRRAKGDFVLSTNIDLLFSDELMAFVAERALEPGVLYRVDRYDTAATLEPGAPIDVQLHAAEAAVIRVCRRDGTLDLRDGSFYRIYDSLYRLPWWLGVPLRVLRDGLHALRRLPAQAVDLAVHGPGRLRRALARRRGDDRFVAEGRTAHLIALTRSGPLRPLRPILLIYLLGTTVARLSIERGTTHVRKLYRLLIFERARIKLHTNASGDFELLARQDWERTNGYAELEMYSMHLDSLHMFMAHWSGIRESYLPYKVFHLEHEGGFRPDPAGSRRLNDRLERDAIEQITNEQLFEWIIHMARTKRPLVMNDERWGLADETFPEVRPTEVRPAAVGT